MSDQSGQSSLSKPAQLVVRLDCRPARTAVAVRGGVLGTRQGRGRRRLHRGGDTRRQADRRRGPRGAVRVFAAIVVEQRGWVADHGAGVPGQRFHPAADPRRPPGWRKRRCPTTPTTSLALHSTKRSRRSRRRPNARPPTPTSPARRLNVAGGVAARARPVRLRAVHIWRGINGNFLDAGPPLAPVYVLLYQIANFEFFEISHRANGAMQCRFGIWMPKTLIGGDDTMYGL